MTTSDEHGGDLRKYSLVSGRPADQIIDFSASINPLGPPPWLRGLISRQVENLIHYPDSRCTELIAAVAARYGALPEQIVVGNGSTEIIHVLPRAIQATRAVVPVPSYIDYAASCELAGLAVRPIRLDGTDGFALDWQQLVTAIPGDEVVFLGQPNNPTGAMFDAGLLKGLAAEAKRTVFVIDEAFADFVEGYDSIAADLPENVIVLRSLTKFYAIPGLRLGFAVASAPIAERIRRLMPDWSVNLFAQAAGIAALADENYARDSRQYVRLHRQELAKSLAALGGFTVYPSAANYLLVRIDRPGLTARVLAGRLLKEYGIAVRVCDNFQGLGDCHIRVAVRTERENRLLAQALSEIVGVSAAAAAKPRRTPAIMFQGTCSSAGKSLLAAAMCRIMLQDGFAVAPFKAQNMSLNSFVTPDGGEMGRAQVVQAQACRLPPDVRMNPVLLKPNSDTGTQVIVMGRPIGNMNVQGYTDYKSQVWQTVADCYDSLAGEYDSIVLEGAGSPAEVNLKSHDIVNMRMARHAESPVLLVGDIDRGGVYASFVGTMEVLDEWERRLIAGFVVNKFRGDQSLLGQAHEFVERFTGRPVLGVVPFLKNLRLPQEDSVDFKAGRCDQAAAPGRCVDIAVIDLPHISNFTDFDALAIEPDVNLRIVRTADELGRPHAVMLPGSKSVIADLDHLRRNGLADAISNLARTGRSRIAGICGGFQMLGRTISDPQSVESSAGSTAGLGLLDVQTVMAAEKTLMPAGAKHSPSGFAVRGYEIHHGRTDCAGLPAAFVRDDGQTIGVSTADGRIWGTYLHGVFDADEFRRHFLDQLRASAGLPAVGSVQVRYDIEPELDRLADAVRTALPIDRIYKVMGLK